MAECSQRKLEGIEKSFCSSWNGWDEVGVGALQFYDADLLPEFAAVVGLSIAPSLYIDCERSVVAIYDEEGEEVFQAKIKLVLDK